MEWTKKLWKGEMPLWKAFWLYGVVVSVLLYVGTLLALGAILLLLFFFIFSQTVPFNVTLLLTIALLPSGAYQVLSSVGIWRSSDKYDGSPVYSLMARATVLCYLAWTALMIVGLFQAASIVHYK